VVAVNNEQELVENEENIDDSMMDSVSEGDLMNKVAMEKPNIEMG